MSFTSHTSQRTDRRLAAGRCKSRLSSTPLRTMTSDEHRTDPRYVKACMQFYGNTYRSRKLSQSFRMTVSYNDSTDEEQTPSCGKCSTLSKDFLCLSASAFVLLPSTFSSRQFQNVIQRCTLRTVSFKGRHRSNFQPCLLVSSFAPLHN